MLFIILLLAAFQTPYAAIEKNLDYQCFADTNTIVFNGSDNLILLTHNTDSLEQAKRKARYPNPFCPSGKELDAVIPVYESSFVNVLIKDGNGIVFNSYSWNSIEPGVYSFHWANDIGKLPGGWYYIVVQTKAGTSIDKVPLVK